jgi:Tfp pilus assembly protein PilW
MKKLTRPRNNRRRRGLGLVELTVCMTISAMLLTATGVAYQAGFQAYRVDEERAVLLSSGQLGMAQLLDDIRNADAHAPLNSAAQSAVNASFAAGTLTNCPGIALLKQNPDNNFPNINPATPSTWVTINYRWDSTSDTLYRDVIVGNGTPTTTVVSPYMQTLNISLQGTRSATNITTGNPNCDILLRAVVQMNLANVDATGKKVYREGSTEAVIRLTGAAMPRKNFQTF